MLDPANTASGVWADTTYRSKANLDLLRRCGLTPQFRRAEPRGRPMPPHIARGNTTRSRVRARVEHVFATEKRRMRIAARTLQGCEPRGLVVREGRCTRSAQGFTHVTETIDEAAPPAPRPHALHTLRIDRMTYTDAAGRERAALRVPIDFEFPPPADCQQ